jgi:hypothetical protein
MAANKIRRTFRPYDRPRPWSARDVERSVQYVLDVIRNWDTGFREAGITDWIRGRSVIELGPGPDLGTGLILLARGARCYLAVDRFLLIGSTPPQFYDALLDRIADEPDVERARRALQMFRDGIPEGDLRYALLPEGPEPAGAPDVPAPDLWLSQATLEHVSDPLPLSRLITSWCSEDAIALHHVDAATHTPWIREADPLNILRYPESLYNALSFTGSPNRWRSSRYVDCFQSIGWELVDNQAVHRISDRSLAHVKPGLAEPFCSMDDDELAVHSFRLVLRRGSA